MATTLRLFFSAPATIVIFTSSFSSLALLVYFLPQTKFLIPSRKGDYFWGYRFCSRSPISRILKKTFENRSNSLQVVYWLLGMGRAAFSSCLSIVFFLKTHLEQNLVNYSGLITSLIILINQFIDQFGGGEKELTSTVNISFSGKRSGKIMLSWAF